MEMSVVNQFLVLGKKQAMSEGRLTKLEEL
jgi:hypothetical protein